MTRGKWFIALILTAALLACCSLNQGTDSGEGSGLRLLQSPEGPSSTLSHLGYDDWSPQIVYWEGTNYIYFLSTRPFSNEMFTNGGWNGTAAKPAETCGIFRARQSEDDPQLFENLQLYYYEEQDTQLQNIVVVGYVNHPEPLIYATRVDETTTNILLYYIPLLGTNVNIKLQDYVQGNILGGKITASDGDETITFIFCGSNQITTNIYTVPNFQSNINVPVEYSVTKFIPHSFVSPPDLSDYPGKSILSLKPQLDSTTETLLGSTLDQVQKTSFNPSGILRGSCPAMFKHPQLINDRFGFFLSLDGKLAMMIYTSYSTYEEYKNQSQNNNFFDDPDSLNNQAIYPLTTVTTYPGAIDQDPHFEPGKGLYFASDRAGRGVKNLYFVPKQYLALPDAFLNLPASD